MAEGKKLIDQAIDQLFKDGALRRMPRNQILIYEGDPITNLYYLVSGYVKVYSILETGSERIIFIYAPGDIFPITTYLSGAGSARYFYESMTDVEMRLVQPEFARDKIKDNLELGEALMHYADAMNQQFIRRIDMLGATDARRKIIALLDFLVDKVGSRTTQSRLSLPLTAQNIADMCGLTRETATKKLIELRRDGLVNGSRYMVVDTAKLQRLQKRLTVPA